MGNILAIRTFLSQHFYLYVIHELEAWYDYLIIPGRMLLLFSFMIPKSLKVSLDIAKYVSSQFINWVCPFSLKSLIYLGLANV
jgi:phospholipid-translocating ATPase